MVLRDLCDLDYAEIAEVLDCRPAPCGRGSPGAARSSWNDSDRAPPDLHAQDLHSQGTRDPPANVRTTMADDERPDAVTDGRALG